jgi:hypothetical protein
MLEKICVSLFANMEANGFDANNVSDDDLLLVAGSIGSALLKSCGIQHPLQDAAQEYSRCLKQYCGMDRDDDGAGQSQGPGKVH